MKIAAVSLAVAMAALATASAAVGAQASTSPPPVNDHCVNATAVDPPVVGGVATTVSGDTAGATSNTVGACGDETTAPGVWYTFAAAPSPYPLVVVASLCSNQTQYGTTISVFTGGCRALQCLEGQQDRAVIDCGVTTVLTFLASPRTQYWLLVHGYEDAAAGTFDLTMSSSLAPPPPPNDECVAASVISSQTILPFVDVVNTFAATVNASDPLLQCTGGGDGKTVWYAWTPPVGGSFDFTVSCSVTGFVSGHAFTPVGLYAGTCGSLTEVACDNGGFGVRYEVTAGENYRMKVGAVDSGTVFSNMTLTFTVNPTAPPPPNDECINATVIPASPSFPYVDVVGSIFSATSNALDPLLNCSFYGGGRDDDRFTVWYSWTPSVSGRYDIIAAAFFGDYKTVHGAFVGHSCGSLVAVMCDRSGNGLRLEVTADETYFFKVGAFRGHGGIFGNLTMTVNPSPPPPPNDECAAATVIPASPTFPFIDFVGNVTSATANELDPLASCILDGDDSDDLITVWYTWTPSTSGPFDFVPNGNFGRYVTVHGVYVGGCGALVEVACDSSGTYLGVDVTAGVTYIIMVGAHLNVGLLGNLTYTINPTPPPPPNDECTNATVIHASPSYPFVDTVVDGRFATAHGLDPGLTCLDGDDGGSTVWYSWTPSVGGRFDFTSRVDGDSGPYSPVQGAYVGRGCGSLVEVACDAYGYGLRVEVGAGKTYFFKVLGLRYGATLRNLSYTVSPSPPPPPNDECANATVIPALPAFPFIGVVSNVTTATFNALDPMLTCGSGDGDDGRTVWYTWSPSVSGRYDFTASTTTISWQLRTLHGVFLGTSCGSLVEVACLSSGNVLRLEINAGGTYFIRIGFFTSSTAVSASVIDLTYTISPTPLPPPNDECINATVIPASPTFPFVGVVVNVTSATDNVLDPLLTCGPDENFSSVWFTWTPSVSGRFQFVTNGDHADYFFATVKGAFVGKCGGVLTAVACETNGMGFLLDVSARETYLIMIDVGVLGRSTGDLNYIITPSVAAS